MAMAGPDPGESRSESSSEPELPEAQRPGLDAIRQHVFHEPQGDKLWQSRPELPAASEILATQDEAEPLPPNYIDIAWPCKNDYLETHYRLLRREGTEALRYAVNKYKSNVAASDDEEMCIYTKVRVLGYLMTRLGPLCRTCFSTEHAQKKIMWQQSRRLRPGSIVAISTKSDNFSTICMTATVAQRPYRGGLDQNPPQIDIVWGNVDDYVIDPDVELVMVEARSGYFEAVRHTLVGLQMASHSDSPIFKYVVEGDKSDGPPTFIRENPVLDLTSCLSETAAPDTVEWLRQYDVREDMPDVRDEISLDESQLHALYRMITKELCIVQGPPGTGKTFTSVEAVRIMLGNQKPTDPPIIVAAQTNHALDQLLTLCLDAGARIIRVGGRTESERVAEHTMYNARQTLGSAADPRFSALEARRRRACNVLTELTSTLFNDRLLQPGDLLHAGVITQQQHDSLVDDDMEQSEIHRPHGPFSLWISGECIETRVLRNKHCDKMFAGDDEEYNRDEYEYEDELEYIAADDDEDEDRIMGTFIPFTYKWTGKEPGHLFSGHRRATRELNKSDLYEIPKNVRGAVYQLLFERYVEKLRPEFLKCFAEYIECCKEVKANRWLRDIGVVNQLQTNIVGCTTTGLTKYRGFLAALGAKLMLVEEAAETRESNITSALYPSVQQLILVGDHMQLAPSCSVRWLGQQPFYLDMSMFERMVTHTGIPYIMLDQQRRMAPEIRAVMEHFYEGLEDHPLVLKRDPVPGMGDRRTWLFAHNWEDSVDANHSRFNSEEATMIVNFFAYLVKNGIKQSQITVLTFYKAQRRIIMRKLRDLGFLVSGAEPFHVHTVDSYQGEENDIVLLSLVRSPAVGREPAVGFLDNKNRVIVAISRARRGFYMFGNISNASRASKKSEEIWAPIWNVFVDQKRYDPARGLPLQCQKHGKTIWFKNTSAWDRNSGGCDQACKFVGECGHRCAFLCHPTSHDGMPCGRVCGKKLDCGHICQKWCKDPCNCVCAAFQAKKTQSKTLQLQDDQQMHMDLEELLHAEATGDGQPGVSPPKPEQRQMVSAGQAPRPSNATVAKPRPIIRLGAQEPHKTGQTRGKPQRNFANQGARRPPKFAQAPSRPAGPVVRPPPPRLQGVDRSKVAAFQEFADNINDYDMAVLKAQKASLAESAGQVPDITDTYRPVKLVDGRRIKSPANSSPEKEAGKVVIQNSPTSPSSPVAPSEMGVSGVLLPELLLDGDSEAVNTTTQVTENMGDGFDMAGVLAALPETGNALFTGRSDHTPTRQLSVGQHDGGSKSTNSAALASVDSPEYLAEGAGSVATTVDPTHGQANSDEGEASRDLAVLVCQPTASRLSVIHEEAAAAARTQPQAYGNMDHWLESLPPVDGDTKTIEGEHEVADRVVTAVADQARGDPEETDLLISF